MSDLIRGFRDVPQETLTLTPVCFVVCYVFGGEYKGLVCASVFLEAELITEVHIVEFKVISKPNVNNSFENFSRHL